MSEFFQFLKYLYTDIRDHFKPPTPVIPPTPVYTSEEIYANLLAMYTDWYNRINELVTAPIDEEVETYNKLKELGFDKIEGMRAALNKKWEIDNAIKYKAMLDHYTPAYPTHLIVHRKLLDTLCTKYELTIGDAKEYIKDIPSRVVTEILGFKFNDEDRQLYSDCRKYYSYKHYWGSAEVPKDITDTQLEELNAGKRIYVRYGDSSTAYQYLTRFVIIAPGEHFSKNGKRIYAGCNDPIVLAELSDQMYMIITMW